MTTPNADGIVRSISDAQKPAKFGLVTVCMADVKPKPIRWLWFPYIALGKLTVIAGHPGLGKSMLTANLASHVSNGRAWADKAPCPAGSVLIASAEDDPEDTLRPRLDVAGADVSRVHGLTCVNEVNGQRAFTLADVVYLEEKVRAMGDCRLVVIDPFSAFMGSSDSHKNSDVRNLLTPLAEMAATHGVAVVTISHLNKGQGESISRVSGSIGLVAAARAAYYVIKDKEDPSRRMFLPAKNNLGKDGEGMAYRITSTYNAASEQDVPYIVWEEDKLDGVSVDEAMRPDDPYSDERSAVDEAEEFLQTMLIDGSRKMKEVQAEANAAGLSMASVRRAKTRLRIIATKHGGDAGKSYWAWALPAAKVTPPLTHAHLDQHEHLPWAPTPVADIQGAHAITLPEHLAGSDDEEVVDL